MPTLHADSYQESKISSRAALQHTDASLNIWPTTKYSTVATWNIKPLSYSSIVPSTILS